MLKLTRLTLGEPAILALMISIFIQLGGCGSDSNNNTEVQSDASANDSDLASSPDTQTVDASTCAQIIESAELTIPTTLSNTDSACDYYVRGTLRVRAELTIEPGTMILMGQDTWIVIDNGSLIAVGTPNQRIQLGGESSIRGFWQGIRFNSARPSRIEYVDISDAGSFANAVSSAQPGAITAASSTLSLVNSTISNSNRDGAYLSSQLGQVLLSEFSDNRFFNNTGKALTISGNLLDSIDASSDYLGRDQPNGDPVVEVEYTALMEANQTVKAINVPYRPINALTAASGGVLTLEPGVHLDLGVSFGRNTGANVPGRYIAIGTPEQPIVFRHSSSVDAQGISSVVEAREGGIVILQHVRLDGVTASAERGGTLQINDARIINSPGYGIQCAPLANAIEGTLNISFENNALDDYSPECMF